MLHVRGGLIGAECGAAVRQAAQRHDAAVVAVVAVGEFVADRPAGRTADRSADTDS